MKITGIYKILNIITNKSYIGQSLDVKDRIRRHKYNLNRGKHSNPHLQKSYIKYGTDNFKYEILYQFDVNGLSKDDICNHLNIKEIEMIILFDSFNNGYNLTTGGDRHYIVSDATKIKLSESHKGIKPSEYCKQKTSERFKGIPKSEETKEKMSKSKKGKPKKHKNWNFGKRGYKIKPASEERKRKIGDAQMGSKNHNYGKKTPESVKQKCRDSYHGEQCHLAKITDEIARTFSSTTDTLSFSIVLKTHTIAFAEGLSTFCPLLYKNPLK